MKKVQRLVKAFTDEQAARLGHITVGQIRYWDRTGFFQPSMAFENRRVAFSRIYSFEDVVALRVLGELRNEHDVPLQHLRRVRDKFQMGQEAWAEEELFVHKKRVYFKTEDGNFVNSETDEETLPNIPLRKVIADVKKEARDFGIRGKDVFGKVSKNRNVARSAEVFEGTRIPIDMVKEYFDEGLTTNDILKDYPTLTNEDVDAAIHYFGIRAA
ncbi:DUF433 domain-containing protein [Roseobacter sp.]|uniref:DUF433 domain-containing protein n=1 Tax=Roseobacter sp. TaxID=1907202 RepID=UPI00296639D3|nr:DUF433 domain-containing protein [Roseobacter sp.]MDW3183186.1 DUF433 domain-containing protein [Roseobacter sp.]